MKAYGYKKQKAEDPWERFKIDTPPTSNDPILVFETLLQYAGYNYYIFTIKED